jgi:superfamily I DNA/RNA helicase
MAVLFRARNVGWKFEKKFKELKIPLYNSSPTWRNSEFLSGTAKNIASYISLAINEYDNDSFDRVINKPKRGLGSKALKLISQVSQTWTQDSVPMSLF